MRIYYCGGGYYDCDEIEFMGDVIMIDHVSYANIEDIERIETI